MSTIPIAADAIRQFSSPHVLVVDDHEDSAEMLASLLPLLIDCTAHVAHSGLEALAVGDAVRPRIVILDISMPGMGGCEAARQMRARPWGGQVRIVALSGWDEDAFDCCGGPAAIDARLTKPVGIGQLLDALQVSGACVP
jgi:CheY-like chemotaxis protein